MEEYSAALLTMSTRDKARLRQLRLEHPSFLNDTTLEKTPIDTFRSSLLSVEVALPNAAHPFELHASFSSSQSRS